MSKLRTLVAIALLTLTTTALSAAPRIPTGDGSSFLERVHRIVTRVVHALDDFKMSPPIP